MALASSPPVTRFVPEPRVLLSGVSWNTYEALVSVLEEQHVHLTYDSGSLELMSPSDPHEWFKKGLARLLETLTEELNIPIRSGGSATFRKQANQKGLEPDECYWLANERAVRGKRVIDLTTDPPPDLAIEIEITSSALNRLEIYAALGVPEVWRFDGDTLQFLQLQDDGTYTPGPQSPRFPFLPATEIEQFLHALGTSDETSLVRSFRAWVRDVLVPRLRGQAGA